MAETQNSATPFLERVLRAPSYGFKRDGAFYRPSPSELFREFFASMNIFKSRKNWLVFFGWLSSIALVVPFYVFVTKYLSWPLFIAAFLYSMVFMGSYGTFWLHRYGTHQAFKFRKGCRRRIFRNICIPVIPCCR